ncbi:glutamate decarboxylase [Pseudovibrio ascidiaceicola]|uniref:glutamate decarboxylase n=1 Tax=Pseudovibrio ascidiaceicola TaxID=285279 RepID=UPI000D69F329|nr:glutamate decarboxylase [Pseudovibrio ascidiaceicola]
MGNTKPDMANTNVDSSMLMPSYGGRVMREPIPKFSLPDRQMEAETAYRIIHDELMLDGNARLNMATFVTTWMEPQAEHLMAETFDKNLIDKDEYPNTAMIEERCIKIVANLFHAPDGFTGSSAIGSSEAVMLAGMALKWKWRDRQKGKGKPTDKPNLILGTNVQVVWEKFCRYWDVEPRFVSMSADRYVIDPDETVAKIDENTIGIVAILGTTYTGEYEPIKEVHDALVISNEQTGFEVPLHIDAASGGFVAPFLQPELEWDFRLPLVKSINVSGHKYGLVYPGVGWVVWRDKTDLPEDLVFHVDYLGGDMPTFTLNFSRPGNQIVGQYYNFLRLGRDGYTRILENLRSIASYLSQNIAQMSEFELLSDGSTIPVFAFRLKDPSKYTVYAVSEYLRVHGWQVPAYAMPEGADDIHVLRIVLREGFSRDMAELLLKDLATVIEKLERESKNGHEAPEKHFAHV